VQLFSAWVGRGLIGDWKGSKKKNKGRVAVLKFRDQVEREHRGSRGEQGGAVREHEGALWGSAGEQQVGA
jgi:hypothetical protein